MSNSHLLGNWGEIAACRFLESRGFVLLERRFRCRGGEIDLIMRRGGLLVFVEVKTRGRWALDRAEAWVDRRKLVRLRRTARVWLAAHPQVRANEYRFDVVAVHCDGADGGAELRHLAGVG